MGVSTRGIRVTRWPRRCWRTACGSSARSFKFHRPRGIFAAGMEEPSALVRLGDEPNQPGDRHRAFRRASSPTSQHAWPSLAFRSGRAGRLARAAVPRRVLLQDVLPLAGAVAAHLGAAAAPHGRARTRAARAGCRRATTRPTRIATCWSSAADRRVWRRRWRRAARAPASSSPRPSASSAGACCAGRGRSSQVGSKRPQRSWRRCPRRSR